MLWRYQSKLNHDLMIASHIVAGIFNGQRTKRSDKWWTFRDFLSSGDKPKPPSGNAVNARYTAHLKATGQDVLWLNE